MTRSAAFFDLDGTVLDRNTLPHYLRFLRSKGRAGLRETARVAVWVLQHKLAVIDMPRVAREVARTMRGRAEAETEALVREWFETEAVRFVRPVAGVVVERHRAMGDEVVLLTAGTPYLADLVARHLDVPNVLCSRLGVLDGLFTGEVVEPICYGFGKVIAAEAFARDRGIALDRSTFYADSFSDLPMLLRVGNPRPVNPDVRLRRYARRAGWPVEQW
ncbi:MAG: HAD family hydrolase [Myxococcota bacterium]|nr:HAD family hydrolase [Myxococcota bacterium]